LGGKAPDTVLRQLGEKKANEKNHGQMFYRGRKDGRRLREKKMASLSGRTDFNPKGTVLQKKGMNT